MSDYYDVRVAREVADKLVADEARPAVLVSVEALDDGTHEMWFQKTDLTIENERLRRVIQDALDVLGPGDDEDGDSPGNMAFAVLNAGLSGDC